MKKLMVAVLMLALVLTGTCANAQTFVDSTGRELELPDKIERVAVSGPYAQIVLLALAPDMMVGLSSAWDDEAREIAGEYADLPVLGQLYGGKGNMNLEQIAATAPQIVLDIGETKDDMGEELSALSGQLGIPFVHVGMTVNTAAQGFRTLGSLLGREQEAEVLAAYCERTLEKIDGIMDRVGQDRARFLYCVGEEGLSVVAKGSYHADMIDRMTDNLAVVENPSSRGTGNEIDMEQLLLWNPDTVIFGPGSIGKEAAKDPVWQAVDAVGKGRYAVAPHVPYNWMGYPPSVQRYMGMQWLAYLLYPQYCDFDMYEATAEYYKLFYHCDLTRELYERITAEAFFQ